MRRLTVFTGAESLGALAAMLTTLASVPQILKISRERRADDISLAANATLAIGLLLWATYGLAIGSLPIIISNLISLLLVAVIIGMKLRFS